MNSKQTQELTSVKLTCPQKPYKGQEQAQNRRVLRDHLFSGRLYTLANIYAQNERPLPLFEKPKRLLKLEVDYFGKPLQLILSGDDSWTETWIYKLRKLSRAMDYQFSIVGAASGAIFGAFGMSEFMSSVFKTFVKTMAATSISIMLGIGILLKSTCPFVNCQAMTLIITNLGLSVSSLASLAWPLIPARMVFQADNDRPFTWVPTAIALLLVVLMGGTSMAQSIGIFTKTASLGYTMSTILGLHRIMTESIKELVPFIYRTITGKDWHVEALASNLTLFTDFVTAVEEFERDKLQDLDSDWTFQQEVFELQNKYKALQLEASRLGMAKTLTPIITTYYQKVTSWLKRVTASGILLAGHRQEPVSLLISGKPGGGKSYMVNNLVRDVGVGYIKWGDIPNEGIANHIYARNPQESFWSAYRGQFCTLYDDFGQISDTEGNPDPEFLELIQAVGDNPFKIPMADLEDKQRGYFRSKLIVATTNLCQLGTTNVKSIRSPSALARRFDVHVKVERVNGSPKITLMLENTECGPTTYDELINILRAKFRAKVQKFEERAQQGQVRDSPVAPVCVASRIAYISAPSSISNTELTRLKHHPEQPNHQYCDPSLPCRQGFQSLWSWITGQQDPLQLVDYSLLRAQLLWDPRCLEFCGHISEEVKLDWFRSLELINDSLEDAGFEPVNFGPMTFPIDRSSEWISRGFRNKPREWRHLLDNHKSLLGETIHFKCSTSQVNILHGLVDSIIEDLAPEGILPAALLINNWAHRIASKVVTQLKRLGGIFVTVVKHIIDFMEHPIGGTTVFNFLFLAACAIPTITLIFMKMVTTTEKVNDYLTGETLQENEEVLAEVALILKEKKATHTLESRDMKGAQKPTKGRTMHMRKEAYSKTDEVTTRYRQARERLERVGIQPVDLLTIQNFQNTFDFVAVRPDIVKRVCVGDGDQEVEDMLLVAAVAFTELQVEAAKRKNWTPLTLYQGMVEQYKLLARQIGADRLMRSMGAESSIVGLAKSDKDLHIFDAWLKQHYERLDLQGSADQNADGVAKVALGNMWDIKAEGALGRASQIFFYTSRTAWCNKHTVERITTDRFTVVKHPKNGDPIEMTFRWTDCTVIKHPDLDLVIIRFPKTMTPHTCMKKHIMLDTDVNFKVLPAGRIVTRHEGEAIHMQAPSPFLIDRASEEAGIIVPARTAIGYSGMNTVVGDCGAPFMAIDPTRQRKICGMHFLGNSFGAGQAVLITVDLLESMEVFANLDKELEYEVQFAPCGVVTSVKDPLGMVPTPFEPTKTKVRRSIIHGAVSAPITAPSILRPTPDLDPMDRGINELQHPTFIVPQDFVTEVQEVLTRYSSGPVLHAETLSLEQALSAEGIPGMEPIELSTSAGLPLCLESGAQGKRKWINDDRTPKPEFREMMETFINQLKDGVLEDPPIFKETLKDERVKLAKCDPKNPQKIKTRLFSATPLKLLVAARMYYGSFMAHAVRNEIRNTCTSGANCSGPDWQMIADWLHEVSTQVDDGDYSCFDTSQPSGFLQAVYDAIRAWYNRNGGTQEDDLIRQRLAELCYHPFRSARGVVYRTNGSLPSGMFGTTQINSGSNLVAFYYAFKVLYPNAGPNEFLEHVRSVSHGDDVLFSVSKNYEGFTSENIGIALKQVGMVFTPADKGGEASKARPITECTFLKRKFTPMCGIYRAPLDVNSSLEMCNWITKCPDPIQATIDNCKAAFRELAISEPDQDLQTKIRDALYKATDGRVTLSLVSRAEMINDFSKHF